MREIDDHIPTSILFAQVGDSVTCFLSCVILLLRDGRQRSQRTCPVFCKSSAVTSTVNTCFTVLFPQTQNIAPVPENPSPGDLMPGQLECGEK